MSHLLSFILMTIPLLLPGISIFSHLREEEVIWKEEGSLWKNLFIVPEHCCPSCLNVAWLFGQ